MAENARIGRYAEPPAVGWTKKELIWLEAAITLPAIDFFLACEDIASMSGRTVAAITQKAKHMQRAAAPKKEPPKDAPVPEIAEIRRPTKAQLMSGNAGRASRARNRTDAEPARNQRA